MVCIQVLAYETRGETGRSGGCLCSVNDPLCLGLTPAACNRQWWHRIHSKKQSQFLSSDCPPSPFPFCVMPELCWFSPFLLQFFFSFSVARILNEMEHFPFSFKPAFPLSHVIHSEVPSPCLTAIGSSYQMVLLVQCSLCASWSKNCGEPGWSCANTAQLLYCWLMGKGEGSSLTSLSVLTPSWLFCSTLQNGCIVLPWTFPQVLYPLSS